MWFYISPVMKAFLKPVPPLLYLVTPRIAVGKSSVVLRFITNTFGEEYLPTIEDRYRKVIDVNGTTVNLDILDTAGQEEFTSARDVWAREGRVSCGIVTLLTCLGPEVVRPLSAFFRYYRVLGVTSLSSLLTMPIVCISELVLIANRITRIPHLGVHSRIQRYISTVVPRP